MVHVINTVLLVGILIIFTSLLSHKEASILLVSSLLLMESCFLRLHCLLLHVMSLAWNKLFLQTSRYS
jgi:hypothetical protein